MNDNYRGGMQTGGSRKTWVFDPSDIEQIGTLRDALVHHDEYFFEEQGMTTLAIVMDKILDDLPPDLADAVRLVHLRGRSLRSAAKTLGVDHKTVKNRVTKGIALMRARLVDSVWMADMLRGYVPREEFAETPVTGNDVSFILKTLGETHEQE